MGNLARVETRLRRGARIAAAATLALVTLGVFFVLQDYGPESAIRRFHRAVQTRDPGELARVTEQPIESPAVQELIRWVDQTRRFGARYQLLRVERQRNEVYAALDYTAPNGENYATVWVVEKKGQAWKVDAARTVTILRDGFLGPR